MFINILKLFSKKIRFHATNKVEKDMISNYFPINRSIVVIPNFIEIPEVLNLKKKKQILFLGRINPIKNIDLLIKSYIELPDNIKSSFKLKIVGQAKLGYEKKYKNKLEQLIRKNNMVDNIELLGPMYGKNKDIIISESYVLVLPSKSENFGNVILESLSQKTPVIVSKYAPWDIVSKNEAGYCVETSIDHIKKKILFIINLNKEEYKILQENALNLVTDNFDINKNIDTWIKYYRS